MKRILHISKFYAPFEGGIENTCKYIIENLSSYEHEVICFNTKKTSSTDLVGKIRVRRVSTFCKIASQNISLNYFFELRKILHEFHPDLIHFHAPNPLIMLYLMLLQPNTCKLIVHWHSDIVEQRILYKIVRPFERRFLKKANIILITSPKYIEKSAPLKAEKKKVQVVESAIDPKRFSIDEDEQDRFQELKSKYHGEKIVFFIGRHVPYKGLEYLLQAEKFIKNDCLLLIGGTGSLTSSLKIKYNSERIMFLGRLSITDLKIYLHLADIFAFPSISKNEAFGLVLAEAMYCETPAVTFKIEGSGVNWVNINNMTGLEVESRNSFLFAKAIDKLLENNELRAQYARNAKERVLEYFSIDKIKLKLEKIYIELLS